MGEIFNLASIGLHMLNAAILGSAMYFLLYKPVRTFMAKRQEGIQSQIDGAAKNSAESERLRLESEQLVRDAQRKAAETIAKGAETAQRRADEIMLNAHEEIKRVRERAEADIEKMRVQAQEALRDEAAELAVTMAEKLIERGITKEDHARLINALVERL